MAKLSCAPFTNHLHFYFNASTGFCCLHEADVQSTLARSVATRLYYLTTLLATAHQIVPPVPILQSTCK